MTGGSKPESHFHKLSGSFRLFKTPGWHRRPAWSNPLWSYENKCFSDLLMHTWWVPFCKWHSIMILRNYHSGNYLMDHGVNCIWFTNHTAEWRKKHQLADLHSFKLLGSGGLASASTRSLSMHNVLHVHIFDPSFRTQQRLEGIHIIFNY